MTEKLLSICISTYNRCNECIRLVESIFELKDNRYNVIICDDASSDGTVKKLKELPYDNLIVKENKKNVGPCKNWYNTINSGTAKYILHVLDRDTLNIVQLQYLLDILGKYDISGGYIGLCAIESVENRESEPNIYLYKKGQDAFLRMGGVPVHPTGCIVRRKFWKHCKLKKYFYLTEKYDIYPHSYVMAHMALEGDMLYMATKFYSYKYVGKTRRSRFYQHNKGKSEFWWMPKSVLKVTLKMIFYLYMYVEGKYQGDFVTKRFEEGLYRATESYRKCVGNKAEMDHYGVPSRSVSNVELFIIAIWFYHFFMIGISGFYADTKNLRKELYKCWKKVMTDIWVNER